MPTILLEFHICNMGSLTSDDMVLSIEGNKIASKIEPMKERVNNNAEILNDKERESVNHTLMQKNPIHLVEEIIVDLPPLPPVWGGRV